MATNIVWVSEFNYMMCTIYVQGMYDICARYVRHNCFTIAHVAAAVAVGGCCRYADDEFVDDDEADDDDDDVDVDDDDDNDHDDEHDNHGDDENDGGDHIEYERVRLDKQSGESSVKVIESD